ncbi:hypothetical protein [Oceanospirillum multiglobuliferum]|uniref:hypothetical protein n=1 Tax=Oceanospirillum multiglobuliferum TaxID=64969 RepID=UPI00147349AD|nr:hypothetical protein [Oceanospirillum multiglobuliferum]
MPADIESIIGTLSNGQKMCHVFESFAYLAEKRSECNLIQQTRIKFSVLLLFCQILSFV